MAGKVYITVTGISKWAVLNSLWGAIHLKGFIPDKVYVLVCREAKSYLPELSKWLKMLLVSYGSKAELVQVEVDEGNFGETAKLVSEIIESEKAHSNEVAIDITPGRKAIVSSILIPGWEKKADHVFYLYLKDLRNADRPYPMIPSDLQKLVDFKSEVWL